MAFMGTSPHPHLSALQVYHSSMDGGSAAAGPPGDRAAPSSSSPEQPPPLPAAQPGGEEGQGGEEGSEQQHSLHQQDGVCVMEGGGSSRSRREEGRLFSEGEEGPGGPAPTPTPTPEHTPQQLEQVGDLGGDSSSSSTITTTTTTTTTATEQSAGSATPAFTWAQVQEMASQSCQKAECGVMQKLRQYKEELARAEQVVDIQAMKRGHRELRPSRLGHQQHAGKSSKAEAKALAYELKKTQRALGRQVESLTAGLESHKRSWLAIATEGLHDVMVQAVSQLLAGLSSALGSVVAGVMGAQDAAAYAEELNQLAQLQLGDAELPSALTERQRQLLTLLRTAQEHQRHLEAQVQLAWGVSGGSNAAPSVADAAPHACAGGEPQASRVEAATTGPLATTAATAAIAAAADTAAAAAAASAGVQVGSGKGLPRMERTPQQAAPRGEGADPPATPATAGPATAGPNSAAAGPDVEEAAKVLLCALQGVT